MFTDDAGNDHDLTAGGSSADSGNIVAGVNGLAANNTEAAVFNDGGITGTSVVMPAAGEIYAISIGCSNARTAGTATAQFIQNGTSNSTDTVVLDGTNTNYHYNNFGTPVSYSAGDRFDMEIVTSSWNPTGTDCAVTIFWRTT